MLCCFVVAAAALVGQGCGGGDEDSDQEAITAVINQLRTVQDNGDGEAACSQVYVIQEGQQRAGELAGEEGAEPVESEEADEAEGAEEAESAEGGESEAESEESEAESEESESEGGEEGEEGESPAECEEAFEAAYERRQEEVKDLTTSIGAIEVDGERATAIVHTELERADGSMLTQDVPYDLVRTPDGWRVRIADEG
jgi:hypothetical protein